MAIESDAVPEDCRSVVIVPLYKDKGEKTECRNYKDFNLLHMLGKNMCGILVDMSP